MIKVSFKEDFKKVQTFNDKATVVTIIGSFPMPDWWMEIPRDIYKWVGEHPSVIVQDNYGEGRIILEVQGKSVCADEDVFNPQLGEWIAESKAKIKLYKFMHTMLFKLEQYYFGITLGDRYYVKPSYVEDSKKDGGLFEAMSKYQGLLIKESYHLGKLLGKS